jgi:pimeloyl-ACP methyl ester carboxylesterase
MHDPLVATVQLPEPGTRRVALSLLASALGLALVLYVVVVVALWFLQERLLFHPVQLDPGTVLAHEPDVHERWVEVPGARLSVLELRLPDPNGLVFFLHGNAGNLASWFVNTDFYRRANYDLVMLDYRGFGKSTGRIQNEAQLHADVQAVWEQVAPRYAGKHIVVYGRSLGTGLAAALAARVQPDLTMLASPYSSMAALARAHYPWVPAGVLRYPLHTDAQITRIRTPVLLLHGDRDELIPLAHSEALASLSRAVQLVVIPGAGHGDLHTFDSYRRAVLGALDALGQDRGDRRLKERQ